MSSNQVWQLCPKCNGEGICSTEGLSTSTTRICPVCNGGKMINVITGLPPYSATLTQSNDLTESKSDKL